VAQRICPRLAFSVDRRHAADVVDADHVCTAQRPAQWLERSRQAELCLTDTYVDCPRFIDYQARLAAHRHDDQSAPSFQFVSSRLTLHPDPAWRGLAHRASHPAGRRVIAGAAGGGVLAVAAIALAGAAFPAAPAVSSASATPTRSPTPSASPAATARAVPTATAAPTATPTQASATATPSPLPTATPAPTAVPRRTYVVQQGDSLGAIAQQFGVSVPALQAANGIADPDEISVGQVLVIP
jgi:LysM repeat protein